MNLNYISFLNTKLRPISNGTPLVLDLFAGCGGLALGFEAQGFSTLGFEKDPDCCATYEKNLYGKSIHVELTRTSEYPSADVVIGGPPCQPFSVRGKRQGTSDERDGFPAFIRAIEQVRPKIFIFENVRGMIHKRNKWYFDEIVSTLRSFDYHIEFQLVNFSHFGVPQRRERVIVVGHGGNFNFPLPSGRIITAGQALGAMAFSEPPESKYLTPSMDKYVAKYEKLSQCIRPRDLHLDQPARTLTCRNLSGATADMMRIRLPNGQRRRLLIREAARLQSFPDRFEFVGKEESQFNQIGNAVPPLFAYLLAGCVQEYLESNLT